MRAPNSDAPANRVADYLSRAVATVGFTAALLATAVPVYADCRWFKVEGYPRGALVEDLRITPGCTTLNSVPTVVNPDGTVAFQLCAWPGSCSLICAAEPQLVTLDIEGVGPRDIVFACEGQVGRISCVCTTSVR